MTDSLKRYYDIYADYLSDTMRTIRQETFGDHEDIGQNSWLTASESREFMTLLGLNSDSSVLEIASGSGGPTLFMAETTGCRVLGMDNNQRGVETARQMTAQMGLEDRAEFRYGDATQPLPFEDNQFDAVICIDAINHFPNRKTVLQEWYRVVKPGGRVLYTDPVMVTGPVANDELAARSSIGFFLFTVPGFNEQTIQSVGFTLSDAKNVTPNAAVIAQRWYDARQRHRDLMLEIEDEAHFDGMQHFFSTVSQLASEERLSRWVFVAQK